MRLWIAVVGTLLLVGCGGKGEGEGEPGVDAGDDVGTDDAGPDASSDATTDGGGGDPERFPEPVVGLVTHQAGLYALEPRRNAAGELAWEWRWDNEGNDGGCFGVAALPSPAGGVDLFCTVMGGYARRRAGETDFELVGPTTVGETGWQNYFPNWWGGTSGDDVGGDVLCGHFRWQPVTGGRGRTGIYCTHDASSDAPQWERISDGLPNFPENGGSTLVVIPRPEGALPSRTAVLATVGTKVWLYRWDDASSSMRWSELEPTRDDALRDLPGSTLFTARLAHPRDGGQIVTVFLARGDAGCVWGSDECPDGRIAFRDFTRSGEPVGDRWVDVAGLDDGSPFPSVFRSAASAGSWSSDPDREAIFFHAMFWSGAAYGTSAGSRVIRLEPAGRGWELTGEADIPSGHVVDGIGVGPDPESPSAHLLYAAANRPAPDLGPGRRSESLVLVSSDYGDGFADLGASYPGAWLYGSIAVDPEFAPGTPAGSGALYLLSAEIVQNAAGEAERRQYDVPFGGLSFGVAAAPGGRQLTGDLVFRDDVSTPWQRPAGTEAGQVLAQFLAVGAASVFFSEWPQSRTPGSLIDGGGVYSLPLDGLERATLEDWDPVWDTGVEPCSPTLRDGTRVPPLASYLAVDPAERNLFALLENGGWPPGPDPYDPWPAGAGCGDGIWRAYRDAAGDPWTWERLDPTTGTPDSVWLEAGDSGEAETIVVGVASEAAPFFHVLEATSGWHPRPVDVGVSAGAGQCVGSGWARDAAAPSLVVVSVSCAEPGPGGEVVQTSHLRVSRDGGATFAPLGTLDRYNGELGPLLLHTYPDGSHRLFVWARRDGMLVQRDPADLGSLEPVVEGLGRSVTTAPGGSEIAILDFVED